jgi:hypothetical protein
MQNIVSVFPPDGTTQCCLISRGAVFILYILRPVFPIVRRSSDHNMYDKSGRGRDKGECSIWGLVELNTSAERGRAGGLHVDYMKEGSCQTRKQISLK